MKVCVLAVVALPAIASAWRLQLYADESYRNIIEDRSGSCSQPCKTLVESKINKASSMHFDRQTINCRVLLYDGNQCTGALLGDSVSGDWNLPSFSTNANDKLNSYKINCGAC